MESPTAKHPVGVGPDAPIAEQQAAQEGDRGTPVRGLKRPAEDDDGTQCEPKRKSTGSPPDGHEEEEVSRLSKNQQRKLRKLQRQTDFAEARREKRKERRAKKQDRRRLEKEAAAAEGRKPVLPKKERRFDPSTQTRVPVTIVVDCQYEGKMREKEQISLSNQITRSYSDNRLAQFPVHLYVSNYEKSSALYHRHQYILRGQNDSWKGVKFIEGDFLDAAKDAQEAMKGPSGGIVTGALRKDDDQDSVTLSPPNPGRARKDPMRVAEPESDEVDKSTVYLTADSPYVLERLQANTTYVVGGLIDRNRHKGLCYRIARQRKVRTARLPIDEFMILQDRHVLATNHVVEIMLRWLELGDWGDAFLKVIPPRKGAALKKAESAAGSAGE